MGCKRLSPLIVRVLYSSQAQLEIQRLAEACIAESGLSGRDDESMTPFDRITLAVLGGETEVWILFIRSAVLGL